MKLHLLLPHNFHFGYSVPKVSVFSNYELEILKPTNKNSLKKIKIDLNKLSPLHWYDGVWENLDYKI
jgi:hypothetical protein